MKLLLTHVPLSRKNYYGARALARLQELVEVTLHEGDAPLDPRGVIAAARDVDFIIADRSTAVPGEIFVVRNVANLVPPFETTPGRHGVSAALEFAVTKLNVEEIVVLGHGMCGGCRAALTQELEGTEPGEGGFIRATVRSLVHQRRIRNEGPAVPFTLTRWENDNLTLSDPVTGRSVEVSSFGPDNRAVYANLLTAKTAAQ